MKHEKIGIYEQNKKSRAAEIAMTFFQLFKFNRLGFREKGGAYGADCLWRHCQIMNTTSISWLMSTKVQMPHAISTQYGTWWNIYVLELTQPYGKFKTRGIELNDMTWCYLAQVHRRSKHKKNQALLVASLRSKAGITKVRWEGLKQAEADGQSNPAVHKSGKLMNLCHALKIPQIHVISIFWVNKKNIVALFVKYLVNIYVLWLISKILYCTPNTLDPSKNYFI